MCNCQCCCCSTAGPPYPAGTFTVTPPPITVLPFTPAAAVPDVPAGSSLSDVITSFNALLASLRAAGLLAT